MRSVYAFVRAVRDKPTGPSFVKALYLGVNATTVVNQQIYTLKPILQRSNRFVKTSLELAD